MYKLVRVLLMPTIDNLDSMPIHLHLIVDHIDTVNWKEGPMLGFQGKLGSRRGTRFPFAFDKDGTLDYGSGCEGEGQWRLDLGSRIAVNQRVCLSGGDGSDPDEYFRVAEIKPLT
jgi:hypothetical protein